MLAPLASFVTKNTRSRCPFRSLQRAACTPGPARLFQLEDFWINFHFHSLFRDRHSERPKNPLRSQTAVFGPLPVAVKMDSYIAERTPAVWPVPRPANDFVIVIDARGQQRMDAARWFH